MCPRVSLPESACSRPMQAREASQPFRRGACPLTAHGDTRRFHRQRRPLTKSKGLRDESTSGASAPTPVATNPTAAVDASL